MPAVGGTSQLLRLLSVATRACAARSCLTIASGLLAQCPCSPPALSKPVCRCALGLLSGWLAHYRHGRAHGLFGPAHARHRPHHSAHAPQSSTNGAQHDILVLARSLDRAPGEHARRRHYDLRPTRITNRSWLRVHRTRRSCVRGEPPGALPSGSRCAACVRDRTLDVPGRGGPALLQVYGRRPLSRQPAVAAATCPHTQCRSSPDVAAAANLEVRLLCSGGSFVNKGYACECMGVKVLSLCFHVLAVSHVFGELNLDDLSAELRVTKKPGRPRAKYLHALQRDGPAVLAATCVSTVARPIETAPAPALAAALFGTSVNGGMGTAHASPESQVPGTSSCGACTSAAGAQHICAAHASAALTIGAPTPAYAIATAIPLAHVPQGAAPSVRVLTVPTSAALRAPLHVQPPAWAHRVLPGAAAPSIAAPAPACSQIVPATTAPSLAPVALATCHPLHVDTAAAVL